MKILIGGREKLSRKYFITGAFIESKYLDMIFTPIELFPSKLIHLTCVLHIDTEIFVIKLYINNYISFYTDFFSFIV